MRYDCRHMGRNGLLTVSALLLLSGPALALTPRHASPLRGDWHAQRSRSRSESNSSRHRHRSASRQDGQKRDDRRGQVPANRLDGTCGGSAVAPALAPSGMERQRPQKSGSNVTVPAQSDCKRP